MRDVSFAETEKSPLLIECGLLMSKITSDVVFHQPARRQDADFGDLRLVMIEDGSCRL
jgi:hypothetical protein